MCIRDRYWTPGTQWVKQAIVVGGVAGDPTVVANSPEWMNVFYGSSTGQLTNAYLAPSTGWVIQTLP